MFVNREEEISRLKRVMDAGESKLVIIYGRRRCGKSTLLKKLMSSSMIYFAADMREKALQIKALSIRIDAMIPGFSVPMYPDWDSLFRSLNNALKSRIALIIDEFPYLVKNSPELPSVLQNIYDDKAHSNFTFILCGSSQMMMHGLVLDANAPLYGRADEILKIQPMSVAHLRKYLGISADEAVTEYSIWGGVPRYWEIRKSSGSLEDALSEHVINQYGLLTDEPERLFSDEIRTSVQAFTLLSLIGSGSHRLSELAGRIGKPATHLSNALAFLTELRYIRREIPFGESLRSTKKSIYRINDPFLNFYFTFVVPDKSRIELGHRTRVLKDIKKRMELYVSSEWEELCRQSVPGLKMGEEFGPASRWWGKGLDGKPLEVDIVSESYDKTKIIVGEVKWNKKGDLSGAAKELMRKTDLLPFRKNYEVIPVLFVRNKPERITGNIRIFSPDEVVEALK
ncbi:MAG TPA: ATP-binding protein [Candidatus Cloacimonadota bacterium]|nr:MAG: Archaeal ATPase [Bacteroidetes bacterium ADurb.Bin145]HOU01872.1 ATP-binding protein [Bacteroidales bacterium]HPM02080.1 ATP-binding protein [Candidatus Cloacimonadota bacterium]HQK67354.1 ATP-binding protein [Bacteroidales bacterium]